MPHTPVPLPAEVVPTPAVHNPDAEPKSLRAHRAQVAYVRASLRCRVSYRHEATGARRRKHD
jgi:hypothetical protein